MIHHRELSIVEADPQAVGSSPHLASCVLRLILILLANVRLGDYCQMSVTGLFYVHSVFIISCQKGRIYCLEESSFI